MATPDTHIEEIRQRLQAMRPEASQPTLDLPWVDRPRSRGSGEPPQAGIPDATTDLGSTVEALRQRSAAIAGTVPEPPALAPESLSPTALPQEVTLHLQRMQGQAYKINELAQQQIVALQAFKQGMDGLAWSLHRHGLAQTWSLETLVRLQAVAVAQVLQGDDGAMVLTQSPVDLFQQEREASSTAQWLRHQRQATPATEQAGWQMVGAEPMAALGRLWQGLTTILERRSRLTPLSLVAWLGGGAIARQALDLLLAASPALWPGLVALVVGAVAFALYRLMTRPTVEFPFMIRLLLALVGLLLGGYV